MPDHSKTEESHRSEEERSMEQPSTSKPNDQRESPEPSTTEKPSTLKLENQPKTSTAMKREAPAEEDGRIERLKRYRKEIAQSICIPDTWGKESLLNGWTDFPSALERSLVPEGLSPARRALVVACPHAG